MTLPTLIQKHSNLVVETKLKKFYSMINQALRMAEAEYGPVEDWYFDRNGFTYEDGKPVPGSSVAEQWFRKYFDKYMPIEAVEYDDNALPIFIFRDGSAFKLMAGAMLAPSHLGDMRDWTYFTAPYDKCIKLYGSEVEARGHCAFPYLFVTKYSNLTESEMTFGLGKGFEPYSYNWNGKDVNWLKNQCYNSQPAYCTAFLQQNNWKIPDDYPYKVNY